MKVIKIGKLYFDEDKFNTHVKKREKEGLINNENDYIKIIEDIIYDFEKAFGIIRLKGGEQLILFKTKDNWLLIFSKDNYRVSSAMKLNDKYNNIKEFIIDMKKHKKNIKEFYEVNYEDIKFQRIIKDIQNGLR